jgi:hypothetical protein
MAAAVRKVPVPLDSLAARAFAAPDYADAFRVTLRNPDLRWVDTCAREIFLATPRWVHLLLALRERLASLAGLKTAVRRPSPADVEDFVFRTGNRLALFEVRDRTADEILLGEDDRHLDFRVSLRLEPDDELRRLTVVTAVRLNGRPGRLYLVLVKPFHRLIVATLLRAAARRIERTGQAHRAARSLAPG